MAESQALLFGLRFKFLHQQLFRECRIAFIGDTETQSTENSKWAARLVNQVTGQPGPKLWSGYGFGAGCPDLSRCPNNSILAFLEEGEASLFLLGTLTRNPILPWKPFL